MIRKLVLLMFLVGSLAFGQGIVDPRNIKQNGATDNQCLMWDNTAGVWAPDTCTAGGLTTDSVGTTELDDDANTPTAGAFVVVETGAASFDYVSANAGTDITADLEEETHATEHSDGGTDPISLQNLAGAVTDSQVPNTITVDLATAATSLASNPTDCSANQFANAIAANGNLTCGAISDSDVPDTITVSNYLLLAGGTMTGQLINGSAVDGSYVPLVLQNTQANASSSTNETVDLHFGFASATDNARIRVGKVGDYTTGADEDSNISFWVDADGTLHEAARITQNSLQIFGFTTPGNDFTLSSGSFTITNNAVGTGGAVYNATKQRGGAAINSADQIALHRYFGLTDTLTEFAQILVTATDATATEEDAEVSLSVIVAGALTERMVIDVTGADFTGILSQAGDPVVVESRLVTAGSGISGGGDLSGDVTLDIDFTELGSLTIGNGSASSLTFGWSLSGATDPQFTAANNLLTLNVPLNVPELQIAGGGAGSFSILEGTAPGAGASAGEHNVYFDSADSLLKSHENGGSVVTYVTLAGTQTLTNKTLTAPVISTISNTGTVTLFTATDTVVGKATTDTLTNKTLDVEGTGNVLTVPTKISMGFVGCSGTTGTILWDTLATGAPTATCSAGSTNTAMMRGKLDFADDATAYSVQRQDIWLPFDWTGNVSFKLLWQAVATIGDVVWQVSTACRADAEVNDVAWNTADTFTDTAKGTTLQLNEVSGTLTMTGCAASELLHIRILRDRAHASDTIADVVSLVAAELTLRRAM